MICKKIANSLKVIFIYISFIKLTSHVHVGPVSCKIKILAESRKTIFLNSFNQFLRSNLAILINFICLESLLEVRDFDKHKKR